MLEETFLSITSDGGPICTSCNTRLKRAEIEQVRKCLTDGTDMKKEVVNGLLIDRCASCGGVWLDRGELDILRDRIEELQDALRGTPAHNFLRGITNKILAG